MLNQFRSIFTRPKVANPIDRNADTALTLEQTATDRRFDCEYRKTYDFPEAFIDAAHQSLHEAPLHPWLMVDLGIEGWLLPADALKLYELGYFAGGNILELGTYRGLSTSILANSAHNSGWRSSVVTVDLDPVSAVEGSANLQRLGIAGRERVRFITGDAIAFVADLAREGHRYSFAFVDHSHRYEHVLTTCQLLHHVIAPGGFVLFHDYNDQRNYAPTEDDYGVYQGVHDGLAPGFFEHWGVFGCTGLFRRTSQM